MAALPFANIGPGRRQYLGPHMEWPVHTCYEAVYAAFPALELYD